MLEVVLPAAGCSGQTLLKAVIMLLDAAVIQGILDTLELPERFNRICIASPDGATEHFSWEK